MKLSEVGGVIAVVNGNVGRSLQQVGAIPMICRIVITYQQAGVFPVVVVVDSDEDRLKRELSCYGVILLQNDNDQLDLLDSACLGLEYLQDKCDRVVFTPVNVPMVKPSTLKTLMQTPGEIVAPSYQGKGGHPVLISNRVIPQILSYHGDEGLRGALDACGAERVWISMEDKGVLANARNQEELLSQLEEHNSSILQPALHIRLEQEEPFFTARLKLLLYLIADTQNMRTACARSCVAHSKAWDMINRLEQNLGYSIVERQRGGKAGGSTKLTPQGEAFLVAYHDFEQSVHQFSQDEFRKRFISTKIIH